MKVINDKVCHYYTFFVIFFMKIYYMLILIHISRSLIMSNKKSLDPPSTSRRLFGRKRTHINSSSSTQSFSPLSCSPNDGSVTPQNDEIHEPLKGTKYFFTTYDNIYINFL